MKVDLIRKIDVVGRVLIPADIRNALGWNSELKISITMQDDSITLRAYKDSCFACGSKENIMPIHNKFICHACIDKINAKE